MILLRVRLAALAVLVLTAMASCDLVGPVAPTTDAPTLAAATPTATPAVTEPLPTAEPTFLVYQVRQSDSLISIARHFQTTPDSIGYWNRQRYASLDPDSAAYAPDRIKVGWLLLIHPGQTTDGDVGPASEPPSPSPSPTTTARPSATPSASPVAVVTPAPTVAPSATPSASPSPIAVTVSRLVTHGPRTSVQVALTFDMGGRQTPALDIMRWLVDHRVPATIFSTGASGSTSIGRQVLAIVAANPTLFTLGNHSWDHPSFVGLTAAQMVDQLDRCEAALAPVAGTTRPFFRPPYGAQDATVREAIGAVGWRYTVMWDVDTIDWKPESQGGPTTAALVAKVLAGVRGGSIVLMHLGGYNTLTALPAIVSGLQDRGLRPVRLAQWWH